MRRGCGCRYPSFFCRRSSSGRGNEAGAITVLRPENSHHRLKGKTTTISERSEQLKRKR